MKKTIILSSVVLLCSCAFIVSGTSQSVAVDTSPAGADCKLTNDDGSWQINDTPGTTTVHRSYSDLNVACEKGAYKGQASVPSYTKGAAFGNILFGGIIGGAVDMSDGAAYDYPSQINIKLRKQ